MTRREYRIAGDPPTTEAEFERQLTALLRAATREGIDVTGGYAISRGDAADGHAITDDAVEGLWDVVVSNVVPRSSAAAHREEE
ncbi:MAG: hypothetical protein ABEJ31_06220 [Haloarculaceae archaeon]